MGVVQQLPTLVACVVFVLLGMGVDGLQRLFMRWTPPSQHPVVHALFKELSKLGVFGIAWFATTQAGVWEFMSEELYGDEFELTRVLQRVDMVLFSSILLFLVFTVAVLRASRRMDQRWHDLETSARAPHPLFQRYERNTLKLKKLTESQAKRNTCAVFRRWCGALACRPCKSRLVRSVEDDELRLVYASMRARFLSPPPDGSQPKEQPAAQQVGGGSAPSKAGRQGSSSATGRRGSLQLLMQEQQRAEGVLEKLDVKLDIVYREKATVFAARLKSALSVGGDVSATGQAGDWITTSPAGELTVIPAQEFEATYERVFPDSYQAPSRQHEGHAEEYDTSGDGDEDGASCMYRRTKRVLGRRTTTACLVMAANGRVTVPAGFTLVQDLKWIRPAHPQLGRTVTGPLRMMHPSKFEAKYERVDPLPEEYVDAEQSELIEEALDDLPMDFDFALYLSTVFSITVVHIVELEWPAWMLVQLVVAVGWLVHVALQDHVDPLIPGLVLGFSLSAFCFALWRKLAWISNQLTSMSALRASRWDEPGGAGAPQPAPSNVASVFRARRGSAVQPVARQRRGSRGYETKEGVQFSALPTDAKRGPRSNIVAPQAPALAGGGLGGGTVQFTVGGAKDVGSDSDSDSGGEVDFIPAAKLHKPGPAPIFSLVNYDSSIRGLMETGRAPAAVSVFANTAAKVVARKIKTRVQRMMARKNALGKFKNAAKRAMLVTVFARVQTALDVAPYLQRKKRNKGSCACCCWRKRGLCVPRNLHEQLFWFGSSGVGFIRLSIQMVMLLTSFYFAFMVLIIFSGNGVCSDVSDTGIDPVTCVGAVVLGLMPPIFVFSMVPLILELFILVSSVESMRKREAIRSVIHNQYLNQAMRALRMLAALILNAAAGFTDKPDADFAADGTIASSPLPRTPDVSLKGRALNARKRHLKYIASRAQMVGVSMVPPTPKPEVVDNTVSQQVYGDVTSGRYIRRKAEVRDVFVVFDRELKGYITLDNMRVLMQALGAGTVTEEVLRRMTTQLDQNSDHRISFEEFFEWIAKQDQSAVGMKDGGEQVSEYMFGLIDADDAGVVTVRKLHHALSRLGNFVRPDELARLVALFDTTDTGTLLLADFKRMLAEHNKFNAWFM